MEISIFGYKVSLEVLILIGVIYLILVGHTVCGCCNFGAFEGFTAGADKPKSDATTASVKGGDMATQQGNGNVKPAGHLAAGKTKDGAAKPNGKAGKEGFVGANINYGESARYEIGVPSAVNTANWVMPDLTVVPGKPLSKAVQNIVDRPNGPIPLENDEMFLFANTQFKPECCSNTYSTGDGCACMNTKTYNYLINRGGNNVPYSEY
jgi:hypothetical protein